MSFIVVFCSSVIGSVFLLSAVSKLRGGQQFRDFVASLTAMRVLPKRLVGATAVVVVAAESTVPLILLPAVWRPVLSVPGLVLAALLLSGFAVAIVTVLRRGVATSCRCFGGSAAAAFGWHHVARNVALVVMAGGGTYAALHTDQIAWQAFALAVPAGLTIAIGISRLDDLVELFAPAPTRR